MKISVTLEHVDLVRLLVGLGALPTKVLTHPKIKLYPKIIEQYTDDDLYCYYRFTTTNMEQLNELELWDLYIICRQIRS